MPTYRTHSGYFQDPTSAVVLNRPSTVQSGDLMVAVVHPMNGGTVTTPSGWTHFVSFGSTAHYYYRLAGASEPTSYTFGTFSSQAAAGLLSVYYDVDQADPVSVHSTAATTQPGDSSKVWADSVTVPNPGTLLLAFLTIGSSNPSLAVSAGPTGMTARNTSRYSTTYSKAILGLWTQDLAATGATGMREATFQLDGYTSYSRHGFLVAVKSPNVPPNAPTSLSPDGKTINRANTNRFSWDFSDPDVGDSQSQYDLRYRLTSSTTWTTVTGTTPNQFRDFPGGTFVAGDYEWQVRTYDALGEVGPYSSSAFFTAADAPAGPSITDPVAGQTISTETYTVHWSTPSQEAFQVRTVADVAGAPDATTVYTDTGEVVSTSTRSRTVAFETNNRTEHVQVRVKDGGLWSSWISVNVDVSYTVPATPTVAVDDTSVTGAILVQASHPTPTGSQPTVTHVDVYRRVTSEGGDGIRIRAGATPTAVTIDYAVASGVDYGYRIRAHGDNGTSSWSAWSEASTAIAAYYGGGY